MNLNNSNILCITENCSVLCIILKKKVKVLLIVRNKSNMHNLQIHVSVQESVKNVPMEEPKNMYISK